MSKFLSATEQQQSKVNFLSINPVEAKLLPTIISWARKRKFSSLFYYQVWLFSYQYIALKKNTRHVAFVSFIFGRYILKNEISTEKWCEKHMIEINVNDKILNEKEREIPNTETVR